jgi:outer membrane protein assembly factor BamB
VGEAQQPVFDSAPGVHDSVPVTHRHQYVVLALDRKDGQVVWSKVVREEWPHEGGHYTGSPASNSPTTDGAFVYAFFGSRGLYCLDSNGALIWQKDLGRMQTLHAHGEGSSPVLHGDTLIVNWDHEANSFLCAFDKRSGQERWRTARDEKTSWSTPLVIEHEGKPQVVVSASKRVRGYDLATGKQLWESAGLTDNVVSSPVHSKGLVIAGSSYNRQSMMAIRLAGANGDITGTDQVVWKLNRLTPYVSSPLLYDDTLYFLRHNQNVLSRLDPATGLPRGEPLRLEGIRDFIFSSPVGAAGRIYVAGRDGATVVLRHDRENAILAVNHLNDSFSASPALLDRELYLRGEKFLYCLAERAEPRTPPRASGGAPRFPRLDLMAPPAERSLQRPKLSVQAQNRDLLAVEVRQGVNELHIRSLQFSQRFLGQITFKSRLENELFGEVVVPWTVRLGIISMQDDRLCGEALDSRLLPANDGRGFFDDQGGGL